MLNDTRYNKTKTKIESAASFKIQHYSFNSENIWL